jgi:hypothetical protein
MRGSAATSTARNTHPRRENLLNESVPRKRDTTSGERARCRFAVPIFLFRVLINPSVVPSVALLVGEASSSVAPDKIIPVHDAFQQFDICNIAASVA